MFSVAIFRIRGGKRAKQLEQTASGIDHHVACARRDENRIARPDPYNLTIDPRCARTLLDVDNLFHASVAVRMARSGFCRWQDVHDAHGDTFRIQNFMRD